LRYGYTHVYRFSQFVEHVRAVTTTRYRYYEGADAARLARMLDSGEVEPDDPATATDATGEDAVVAQVQAREWERLLVADEPLPARETAVRRRPALRWIDALRERFPLGDR
jgi:hypothetical protein